MKKIITIVIACALTLALAGAAWADVDLSAMSFAELAELHTQVQLEMFARQEWQSVQVPQGIYLVGRDIPAGQWNVKALETSWTFIEVGWELDEGGMKIKHPGKIAQSVMGPQCSIYKAGDCTEFAITVEDGDWVRITNGNAIFETFIGPKLGFK